MANQTKKQIKEAKAAEAKEVKAAAEEKTNATEDTATDTQGADTETKGDEKGTEPEAKVFERPAEACEVWGESDPNSRICKSCPVFDECGEYTASLNAAKPKKASTRKARAVHDGTYTQFGHCRSTSQAGLIELSLGEPTTVKALMAAAGCTKSRVIAHLGFLNKKTTCKKVVDEGNKFHYEVVHETPAADEGRAA